MKFRDPEHEFDEVLERLIAVTPTVDAAISDGLSETLRVAESDGDNPSYVVERVTTPPPSATPTAGEGEPPAEGPSPARHLTARARNA